MKPRNKYAKELREERFTMRVVPVKKLYKRKAKHRLRDDG
jgi:hypothetical protein